MELIKNMLILVGILLCAGIPYLFMVLWHAITKQPPPEAFYSLTMVNISIFYAIKIVVLFRMSKAVKTIAIEYLQKSLWF
jgi:hypothetical protein